MQHPFRVVQVVLTLKESSLLKLRWYDNLHPFIRETPELSFSVWYQQRFFFRLFLRGHWGCKEN
jgi:hypothetical protein